MAVTKATAAAAAPQGKGPAPKAAAPASKTTNGAQAQTQAAKATTTTKKVESDFIIQTANTIGNLDEQGALDMLREALEEQGGNEFVLGGILSTIQVHGFWENKGYDTFKAFVETEYGIQYRKAMYLIEIYNGMVEAGIPWEKVNHLGWTKLKEIAKYLTVDNVDEWVERAEEMTAVQLIEYIKEQKKQATGGSAGGSAGGPVSTTGDAAQISVMNFKVHPDQKEMITTALDKAKDDLGTEYPAVALTHIATTFMEGGTGKPKAGAKAAPAAPAKVDPVEAIKAAKEPQKKEALEFLMAELGYEVVLEMWEAVFADVNISVEV